MDESELFLKSAKDSGTIIYSFCWLIASTGCRISEVLALTRESIDFAAKSLIVECLKKRRRHVFRAIPLPEELLRLLRQHIGTGLAQGERLWPWSRMTGYRRICEVMRAAGISGPHATPKGLRHGFGVRALQSGVPLNLVQRWLGHADMKTTAIYTCVMGPEEREIASRMWRRDGVAAPGPVREDMPPARAVDREEDAGFRPLRAPQKPWSDERSANPASRTACAMLQFWLKCIANSLRNPYVYPGSTQPMESGRDAGRRRGAGHATRVDIATSVT